MSLPDRVRVVVDGYLNAAEAEASGVVEGLYLIGSTALGEFRPNTSDVDFFAVTSAEPDSATLDALQRAHQRLRRQWPRPFFDGRYVTWNDLARDPALVGPGPYCYQGRFHRRGSGDCGPVAWHTVAHHGVRCRGPERGDLAVWTDSGALKTWTCGNFDTYWQPLLRRARRVVDPWCATSFTSYGAAWIVLGVCRLHYTLATGRIASKDEAGRYGLGTFPSQWHLVLNEALRIRRSDTARADIGSALSETLHDLRIRRTVGGGSLYSTPVRRRRDVLAFAEMVIDDAKSAFATDAGFGIMRSLTTDGASASASVNQVGLYQAT